MPAFQTIHDRIYITRRYDGLVSTGFVKNVRVKYNVNDWMMSYFLFVIQLWVDSLTNVSAGNLM